MIEGSEGLEDLLGLAKPAAAFTEEDYKNLLEWERLQRERRLWFFKPYPKQAAFLEAGATFMQRMFFAGNQLGKSETGAFEAACHATGEYPDWWKGRRFKKENVGWVCGTTGKKVRNVQQVKLCGMYGIKDKLGTGLIPKKAFVGEPSTNRGVTHSFDTVFVKHKCGGVSVIRFKSYDQNIDEFESETVDWVWLDEECDEDTYTACLSRLTATNGMLYLTFTPLNGFTQVVLNFMRKDNPDMWYTTMTINEAEHITSEQKDKMMLAYPAHEREARLNGVPLQGEGAIFPYQRDSLIVPPFAYIPAHWAKIWGIDFGTGHAFAAVLLVWDRDNDVIYLVHTIRVKDQLPMQHAKPMRMVGAEVPVAWPQDGHQRQAGGSDLTALQKLYKAEGLAMLPDHAKHIDGSNSTWPGIVEMQDRMATGRFKVYAHLSDWWEEYSMYHMKDGQIVKRNDDLMSATRVGVMCKRFAKAVPLATANGVRYDSGRTSDIQIAKGVDFDMS